MDEASHIRGTGFGMTFLEMMEDLHPIDLVAGGCSISVRLERGGTGGPVIAVIPADMTHAAMGIWSFDISAAVDAEIWPDDVVSVVAEYSTPHPIKIRQAKALIHPFRSA